MSRARYDGLNGLLLIAATTLVILTARQLLQTGTKARPYSVLLTPADCPAPASADLQPRRSTRRRKSILWRVYQRTEDDRLLATAAGVVFFGMLAVFPAVTALVSSYGLFAEPSTIGANLQALSLMLPDGSFQIVQDQITRVLAKGPAALGWTFLFGLALALWSANAGIKAIIDALNVAHEVRETRSFIRLNLLSLAFTVGGIAAVLLMVSAVVAFPLAVGRVGLPDGFGIILGLARWPLLFAVLVVALGVLYRFGPNRPNPQWEWTRAGTLAAALLWIAGSAGLSWYLSNFADYGATYGSLGAAIGLMMWMWMSATIVLFGAELNSEIDPQKPAVAARRTPTVQPPVPGVSKEH